MLMMRLMMQIFHRSKNGEVRLFAFMRRGFYLLFLGGMLAGKARGGMDATCMYSWHILRIMYPRKC